MMIILMELLFVFDEFICNHCRNALYSRKPWMPDQACANGLKVYDIPQDLKDVYLIGKITCFLFIYHSNCDCHEKVWWSLQDQ